MWFISLTYAVVYKYRPSSLYASNVETGADSGLVSQFRQPMWTVRTYSLHFNMQAKQYLLDMFVNGCQKIKQESKLCFRLIPSVLYWAMSLVPLLWIGEDLIRNYYYG